MNSHNARKTSNWHLSALFPFLAPCNPLGSYITCEAAPSSTFCGGDSVLGTRMISVTRREKIDVGTVLDSKLSVGVLSPHVPRERPVTSLGRTGTPNSSELGVYATLNDGCLYEPRDHESDMPFHPGVPPAYELPFTNDGKTDSDGQELYLN